MGFVPEINYLVSCILYNRHLKKQPLDTKNTISAEVDRDRHCTVK